MSFERINSINELELGHEYMIRITLGSVDTNRYLKYKGTFQKIKELKYGKALWFKVFDDNFNVTKKYDFIIMDRQFDFSTDIFKLPSFKIGRNKLLKLTMPNIGNEELTRYTKDYIH